MGFRLGVVLALTISSLKRALRKPMTLFWEVIFPIFMITLVVYVFIPTNTETPAKTVKVLLIAEDSSLISDCEMLANIMNNITVDNYRLFNATVAKDIDLEIALDLLRNKTYDVIILLPLDFRENIEKLKVHVKIYRLTGTLDKLSEQVVAYTVRSFFETMGRYLTAKGLIYLTCKIEEYNVTILEDPFVRIVVSNAEEIAFNNTLIEEYKVLPRKKISPTEIRRYVAGIMAMAMAFVDYLFIGILGTGLSIVEKFEKRYMERLLSTKLSPWELFVGLIFTIIIEGFFVTAVCLIYATFALKALFAISLFSIEVLFIAVIALLAIILTASIGIILGTLLRNTEAVSTVANIIIWPTMFLGGIWLPEWMIPESVRWFAEYNPLSHMLHAITDIMTYGKPLINYIPTLMEALVISIVLLSISTILYKRYITIFFER